MTDTTTQLDIPGLDGELSTTQLRMLSRGLNILKSLPVEFIVVSGGETYTQGELELVRKKPVKTKARRAPKYPRGAVRAYIEPFMQGADVGAVIEVPIGDFDMATIQSGACNVACRYWGPGSYTSARIRSKNLVEIMRVS